MPSLLLLGEDEIAVDDHLEDASARGPDRELGRRLLEFLEQPGRQTDGSRTVASAAAVLDRYLH